MGFRENLEREGTEGGNLVLFNLYLSPPLSWFPISCLSLHCSLPRKHISAHHVTQPPLPPDQWEVQVGGGVEERWKENVAGAFTCLASSLLLYGYDSGRALPQHGF